MFPHLIVRPGKEAPVRAGHPWIFSEGILSAPKDHEPGQFVEVYDVGQHLLGIGSYHQKQSIAVRLYDKEVVAIDAAWFAKKISALATWKKALLPANTNGYRVVHAESDGIPGLIVDLYDDVAVFQIHTAGADHLRDEIIKGIQTALSPRAIVERSDVLARKQEGLEMKSVIVHSGTVDGLVPFVEAGLKFVADPLHGQKTGFFLDQRVARISIQKYAKEKNVLNFFGYSGAFSIHALAGGAKKVTTVDISHEALELAEKQVGMNDLDPEGTRSSMLQADVMRLLEDEEWKEPADIIVCDPPAFAKTDKHREDALKSYTWLNEQCLKRLPVGGILITSSCSGRITPDDFRTMLRIAAGRARRKVRVLEWIGHDVDHAELLTFSEGRYLKTAILLIEA